MTAIPWVHRVFGLLLTVSPSVQADEIEIIGRLQIQAQLENAEERSRITGLLLDELGRPIVGTLEIRTTDSSKSLPLKPCSSAAETTQLTSSEQGDFCAWLSSAKDEMSVFASAEHYQTTHTKIQRDRSPLLPPRFLSAPTSLTRGSDRVNTVEVQASVAMPIVGAISQAELALRCGNSRSSLGKQPIHASRIVFEFVTPADAALGTCQLEAELSALGKTPAITRVDVLVQAEVTLQVSQVKVNTETATVELLALAGADTPKGAIEATRGPLILGSVPVRPSGATVMEVSLLGEAGEVVFRVVPGSSEYVPGAPATALLPKMAANQSGWFWHSIGALCFFCWLSWRWLKAARPRTQPTQVERGLGVERARALSPSSGKIRGLVFDVHTKTPLGKVQLTLVEPRADGETVVESAVSNVEGVFEFETQFSRQSLLRLRTTHEHFMTSATAVTAADLAIDLRSTRRAALQSLIAWARRSGRPWDVAPTPTTGHVRQVAERHHEPAVGAWAAEVEQAAFGPSSPSEPEVAELLGRTPKDPHKTGSLQLSRKH